MIFKIEKDVKRQITKLLKSLGIYYYMPPANLFGRAGIPDYICCIHGKFIGIEAKSPSTGEKGLTGLQRKTRREIKDNGGYYFVVWDELTLENLSFKLRTIIREE